ncbi:hypothetical protein D7Z54_05810 [Salibacterium salarium]|uniref:Uncharacterized protein n=1 Tax=Salibacterium salarium TaxID=284579 RepID=A0A3R9QW45_9BACI|nr:hypothetical protein [Salibacterium salarium]RSL34650.1 hypothetical protein D7Z54_05810 [Salibacterium salarium]
MEPYLSDDINLDASFLLWLNKQTDYLENEEWMLDAFLFALRKISRHNFIRLDKDFYLHRRFWKGMEFPFRYKLLTKRKKPGDFVLYHFIETVLITEEWIIKDSHYASITDKGEAFLCLPRKAQWNQILGYIWPQQ